MATGGRRHEPAVFAGGRTIALIHGLTFAVSDPSGEIDTGHEGLIAGDTRHVSRLVVRVDNAPVQAVGAAMLGPDIARFAGTAVTRDTSPDAPLEVHRTRAVGDGVFVEEIELHWWGTVAREVPVIVEVDADFADIFEVRALDADVGTPRRRHPVDVEWTADGMVLRELGVHLETRVTCDPPPDGRAAAGMVWAAHVRRGEPWRIIVRIDTGRESSVPEAPRPAALEDPVVASVPPILARACVAGLADLDALSLADPLDPTRAVTAAGIPWFVALFGRDSLIAARQARLFRPERLVDALCALAVRQGVEDDPEREEQPGKVLHEVRLTRRPWLQGATGTADGTRPYFGSVDATPLFLMALGTALRWGAPRSAVVDLMPAAHAALAWLRGPGDPDGDGLIEYAPSTPHGLRNQGWKDSANAIQWPDGTLAEGPIAVVEAQAYAYRGRLDFAQVLDAMGEPDEAEELREEAEELRQAICRRFWVAGDDGSPGYFAVALDGDKRAVRSVASNMGHLLWCGVPDPPAAADVAAHLTGSGLASGFGLRTLSARMAGFNPNGYHVGSVWPHDTAIACDGLRRYGHLEACHTLATGLMDAMAMFELRLPELFGGHDRATHEAPIPFPTACRPQAWAAGVPLQLVAVFLGIEPNLTEGRIVIAPALPPGIDELAVHGIRFPTGRLSVRVRRSGETDICEAPRGVAIELAAG